MTEKGQDKAAEITTFARKSGREKFVLMNSYELEVLIQLVKEGTLKRFDLLVFMTFMTFVDWRSGRCKVKVQKIAEILGQHRCNIYPSIKRFRETRLMFDYEDERTGDRFFIISPYIVYSGKGQARGVLIKMYKEAMKKYYPDTKLLDEDEALDEDQDKDQDKDHDHYQAEDIDTFGL